MTVAVQKPTFLLTGFMLAAAGPAHAADSISLQVLISATVIGFLFGLLSATLVSSFRSRNLLRQAVTTDPLTRLHNRGAILKVAEESLTNSRTDGSPLSVVLFELDSFPELNHEYGHQAGDEVLQLAALSAKRVLRGEDSIGRFSSAMFLIILPNARSQQARQVAERLRQGIQNQPLLLDELPFQVTICLGVAELSGKDQDLDDLLDRVEAALEAARSDGPNVVHVAVP